MWGLQHRKTRGPLFCSGFSTVTLNGGVILGHFAEYFLVGEDVFLSVVSILQCTIAPPANKVLASTLDPFNFSSKN